MEWDLGLRGVGLLLAMSIGFGVLAQLVMGKTTMHWLWIVATVSYFVSGLFVSEVWFGWATEEDLQPNIDGLSFDEALLLATLAGILVVVATWMVDAAYPGSPSLTRGTEGIDEGSASLSGRAVACGVGHLAPVSDGGCRARIRRDQPR